MYVCMYVCIYINICKHPQVHHRLYVCMYVCMYVVCAYAYVYTSTGSHAYVCIHVLKHIRMHAYIYTNTYTYACACIHTHYTCACIHTHTHMDAYTCMHTRIQTHTYIHIHMYANACAHTCYANMWHAIHKHAFFWGGESRPPTVPKTVKPEKFYFLLRPSESSSTKPATTGHVCASTRLEEMHAIWDLYLVIVSGQMSQQRLDHFIDLVFAGTIRLDLACERLHGVRESAKEQVLLDEPVIGK